MVHVAPISIAFDGGFHWKTHSHNAILQAFFSRFLLILWNIDLADVLLSGTGQTV